MKKLLLAILLFSIFKGFAQEPYEGKVEYSKKDQPVAIIDLPYSPNIVEESIKDYMNKRGVKGNSTRGFQLYKGTKLYDMDRDNSDLYFKVERKTRKEKDASSVFLFATKENENPANRAEGDFYGLQEGKIFLKNLVPVVESYSLEVEIGGQENEVKKIEKKYNNLLDEGKNLEKKLRKLQDNIEQNRKDQEKMVQEVENQRKMLENLKGKRKS